MTISKKKLFEKLLKFQRNEKGNVGTLMAVFYAVIIVVAIAVAFTLAGVIGSSIEGSVTIPGCSNNTNATTCAASALPGSGWNNSINSNIVTGAEIWTTQGALLSAVVIIAVAAMALAALFAIFGGGIGGGKGGKGGGL